LQEDETKDDDNCDGEKDMLNGGKCTRKERDMMKEDKEWRQQRDKATYCYIHHHFPGNKVHHFFTGEQARKNIYKKRQMIHFLGEDHHKQGRQNCFPPS